MTDNMITEIKHQDPDKSCRDDRIHIFFPRDIQGDGHLDAAAGALILVFEDGKYPACLKQTPGSTF